MLIGGGSLWRSVTGLGLTLTAIADYYRDKHLTSQTCSQHACLFLHFKAESQFGTGFYAETTEILQSTERV